MKYDHTFTECPWLADIGTWQGFIHPYMIVSDMETNTTLTGTDKSANIAALCTAGLFILYFFLFSMWRFVSFQFELDWSIIANSVFYASRGSFFGNALKGFGEYSFWQEHISPLLFVYVPLFRLWPGAGNVAMILSQAAANGVAGYLLFRLASRWFSHGWTAFAVMLAFFLNGRFQMAMLHDYHMLTLTPLFLFGAWLASESNRKSWMWACVIGTLMVREDAFLALLGLPLYQILFQRRWKDAATILALVILYEALLFGVAFPAFREGRQYEFVSHYAWLGNTPGEIAQNILLHPVRVGNMLLTARDNTQLVVFLSQFLFMPMLSIQGWITALPAMSESILSNAPQLCCYGYHYVVPQIAALTVAMLLTIRFWTHKLRHRVETWKPTMVLMAVLCALNIVQGKHQGAMPWSDYARMPDVRFSAKQVKRIAAADRLASLSLARGKVQCSMNLFGRYHASTNCLPYRGNSAIEDSITSLLLDPLSGIREYGYGVSFYDMRELIRDNKWFVVDTDSHVYLFERTRAGKPRDVSSHPILVLPLSPRSVHTHTGKRTFDNTMLVSTPGKEGWLVYGRYLRLPPGRYRTTVRITGSAGKCLGTVSLSADGGRSTLHSRDITISGGDESPTTIVFETVLTNSVEDAELTIYSRGTGELAFHDAVIEWIP